MTPNVFIDKDPDHLHRFSQWSDWSVTVVGIGIAGFACADALAQLGARVTVVDAGDGERQRERAEILDVIGVTVRLGHEGGAPAGTDLLVVSPGLRPSAPIIVDAIDRGIPVWGELELAWRLRHPDSAAAWLCVTGTNGKTTATLMLESMLRAAGYRTVAAGNIGHSLVDVVMHDELDVIAIEVGAPQLPFVHTMSPVASVCLNIADDHIDHFGSMDAYVAAKARVYERTQEAAVYNVQDPVTLRMVEDADVIDGCRAIGFTLGAPSLSMLGVVDDLLVDRAFIPDRNESAQELGTIDDVRPKAPHNVANALAAAALARAFGVPPTAVRDGLRAFTPAAHRIATVGTAGGVTYVDDSKATNAHAAQTSLSAVRAHRVDRRRHGEGAGVRRPRGIGALAPARRGAARRGPRSHRRGTRPTRAGCAGHRRRQPRDWGHGRGGPARRVARPAGGHCPPCARVRVLGHVP